MRNGLALHLLLCFMVQGEGLFGLSGIPRSLSLSHSLFLPYVFAVLFIGGERYYNWMAA